VSDITKRLHKVGEDAAAERVRLLERKANAWDWMRRQPDRDVLITWSDDAIDQERKRRP